MFHGAGSRTSHSETTAQERDTQDLILLGFGPQLNGLRQPEILTFISNHPHYSGDSKPQNLAGYSLKCCF